MLILEKLSTLQNAVGKRILSAPQVDSGLALDFSSSVSVISAVSFARILMGFQTKDLSLPFLFSFASLTSFLILWEAKFNSGKEEGAAPVFYKAVWSLNGIAFALTPS